MAQLTAQYSTVVPGVSLGVTSNVGPGFNFGISPDRSQSGSHYSWYYDETFCLRLFHWANLVVHSGGSFCWAILVGHFGGPLWWAILVGHFGGPFWWAILVGHFGGSFWWAISLEHSGSVRSVI
jgi:hypothetical protein